MENLVFPIPNSGHLEVVQRSASVYDLEFAALNTADCRLLQGFLLRMQGRLREFQFEHKGLVIPKCRFDCDEVSFVQDGPGSHGVTLPIKVLP